MRLLWLLVCLVGCSRTTLTQPSFEFSPKTITPTDTLQVVLKQDTAGAKTKYWWSLNESPCPNLNGDGLDVTAVNQMETFCTDDEEPVVVGNIWSVVIQQQMDGLYSPPFKADIVGKADADADADADAYSYAYADAASESGAGWWAECVRFSAHGWVMYGE